jgi:hypothetical protein
VKRCSALLILAALSIEAQPVVGPAWYRSATGMLGRPAANIDAREIERLGRYLVFGVPYCGTLTARDYAANQVVARNMAAYLATVNSTATDPQARLAAARVAASFAAFPCAFAGAKLPVVPPPPPQPGDPPFALKAPDLGKVPDAEQETAADLLVRYDTDAPRAASAWKSAETMRLNLAARGMSLNAQTAASVNRFQLFFDRAAAALREHNWDEALNSLQGVEAETEKVAKVVGR